MKNKLTILLILCSLSAFSQTNFIVGFEEGFEEGYCDEKHIGCISPIPPIPPAPSIYEDSDSYTDGYNKGFKTGLQRQESEGNSSTSSGYKTSPSKFVDDNMYNPYKNMNINDVVKAADNVLKSKGLALEYLEAGQYQAVKAICQKWLNIRPNDAEFMMLLGAAYENTGNDEMALKWLKKARWNNSSIPGLKDKVKSLKAKLK
jgi:tetratricopeptide (TPR) repeat protein